MHRSLLAADKEGLPVARRDLDLGSVETALSRRGNHELLTVRHSSSGTAYLAADEGLYQNQFLLSCDGRFRLYMQGDGNLVLAQKDASGNFSIPLWTSRTNGLEVDELIMGEDSNLVMYNGDAAPVWATNTAGNLGGLHLKLFNDGNMKLYDATDGVVWTTNTGGH